MSDTNLPRGQEGRIGNAQPGETVQFNQVDNRNEPCSFNNGKPTEFSGFYERAMTKPKANTLDGYLEMLGDYFDKLEVFPTMSWPRPHFPFQWRATSVHFVGDDDVWEGLGESPTEAVRNLYNKMKKFYQEDL